LPRHTGLSVKQQPNHKILMYANVMMTLTWAMVISRCLIPVSALTPTFLSVTSCLGLL
jgi:hypothetical protein